MERDLYQLAALLLWAIHLYFLRKIKARMQQTEIRWIFFGIHTANAIRLIPEMNRQRLENTALKENTHIVSYRTWLKMNRAVKNMPNRKKNRKKNSTRN